MNHKEKGNGNYKTFGLMMLTSFIMMYGIMFLNIFEIDHVYLSTTRTYMTLLMVSPMAISMLLFMWRMYGDKRINFTIIGVSILVFCFSLIGLRTQSSIDDLWN